MIRVRRLRQVYLVAGDLDRQAKFYAEVLGLQLQFRDGDRWVQFSLGDTTLALASEQEGMGGDTNVPALVLDVEDLRAAVGELVAQGCLVRAERDMGPHGTAVAIKDPQGVHLVLFQKSSSR